MSELTTNGSFLNQSYLEDSGVFLGTKQNRPNAHTVKPPRILRSINSSTPLYHLPRCIVGIQHSKGVFPSPLYNRKCDQNYLNQCYEIMYKIGEGSFGSVYKVRSKEDNKMYAVKVFKEPFRNRSHRKKLLEEVKRHQQLSKHVNIVTLHQAWEDEGYLFILLELCETSLDIYSRENHNIKESMVWDILLDMLLAVKHIHERNLIHMDIKLENILLARDGSFKLSDFGLVLDVTQPSVNKEAIEGDPKYLAPEVMEGKFSKPADIFSLGIGVLEVACDLVLPGGGEEAWHHLRQWKIPQQQTAKLTTDLVQTISSMMNPDPQLRPTADDLLATPALRKLLKVRKVKRLVNCVKSFGAGLLSLCFNPFLNLLSLWGRLTSFLFTRKHNYTTKPINNNAPAVTSTPNRSPVLTSKFTGIGHSTPICNGNDSSLLDFSNNSQIFSLGRSNVRARQQGNSILSQKKIFAKRKLCYNFSDSE